MGGLNPQFLIAGFSFCFLMKEMQGQIDSSSNKSWPENKPDYVIVNPVPKPKFWGNAWYIAAGVTRSVSKQLEFNLGRSTVAKATSGYSFFSWGMGYELASRQGSLHHLGKIFGEISAFTSMMPLTMRSEYAFDFSAGQHYLRPMIGFNFFYGNILYSYSFPLTKGESIFKNAITLRIIIFTNRKKWTYWKWNDGN